MQASGLKERKDWKYDSKFTNIQAELLEIKIAWLKFKKLNGGINRINTAVGRTNELKDTSEGIITWSPRKKETKYMKKFKKQER